MTTLNSQNLDHHSINYYISRILVALFVLIAWGCGGSVAVKDATPRGPVTDLSSRSVTPPVAERNPAVVSGQKNAAAHLMRSAKRSVQAGKLAKGAEMLERAKRIDPYNAVLWSNLADIRFKQQQYRYAEGMALRSNSYAGSDRKLKRINWQIIAKAREARGDKEGTAKAQEKVRSLQ